MEPFPGSPDYFISEAGNLRDELAYLRADLAAALSERDAHREAAQLSLVEIEKLKGELEQAKRKAQTKESNTGPGISAHKGEGSAEE